MLSAYYIKNHLCAFGAKFNIDLGSSSKWYLWSNTLFMVKIVERDSTDEFGALGYLVVLRLSNHDQETTR